MLQDVGLHDGSNPRLEKGLAQTDTLIPKVFDFLEGQIEALETISLTSTHKIKLMVGQTCFLGQK